MSDKCYITGIDPASSDADHTGLVVYQNGQVITALVDGQVLFGDGNITPKIKQIVDRIKAINWPLEIDVTAERVDEPKQLGDGDSE